MKRRATAWLLRASVVGVVLGIADPAYNATTVSLPASVVQLFAKGKWDQTPRYFRVIAMSFIADGCVAEARQNDTLRAAAVHCVDQALTLARKTHAPPSVANDDAIWLAHLALLLGAREQLGNCPDPDLHTAITTELAQRSLSEPSGIPPSYAGHTERYPADQAAVLAALVRYDKHHHTQLAAEPLERFDTYLREHATDAATQLPYSEVSGTITGKLPRGCALSWQTRYLAEALPRRAKADWQLYRDAYLVDTALLVGFREWPPGVVRAGDVDSGPIVHGVGAAATALAMSAARSMGEPTLATRIAATDAMVSTVAAHDERMASSVHTIIADAIRYIGQTATPRF